MPTTNHARLLAPSHNATQPSSNKPTDRAVATCACPRSAMRPATLAISAPATPASPTSPMPASPRRCAGPASSSAMVENNTLTDANDSAPSKARLRNLGCRSASVPSDRKTWP